MNEIEKINNAIWNLWQKYPREAGFITPKFVKEPTRNTLLFLGLNPSFPKAGNWQNNCKWQNHWQTIKKLGLFDDENDTDYRQAFLWERSEKIFEENRKTAIELFAFIHHDARSYYPKWFKRLNCLAKKLGVEREKYDHVDLFLWADASSESIETRVAILAGHKIVNAQKCLAKQLLKICQPKMIVCVYKNAWEHFRKLYSICPGEMMEHTLQGEKGNAVLKYAEVKIDGMINSVTVIGCPNLPRGYGKYQIGKEHLRNLFCFLNECWGAGKK